MRFAPAPSGVPMSVEQVSAWASASPVEDTIAAADRARNLVLRKDGRRITVPLNPSSEFDPRSTIRRGPVGVP